MTNVTNVNIEDNAVTEHLSSLSEPARLHEIELTGLLESEGDDSLDQLARVAAAAVRAPQSYITLVTDARQLIPGFADPNAVIDRSQPLRSSLCQFSIATGEPLVIDDGEQDQLVRGTDLVRSGRVAAYAGIPLRTSRGHVLGTLCVIDSRPRHWDARELELLRDLAAIAIRDIQHRIDKAQETQIRDLAEQLSRATMSVVDAIAPLVSAAEGRDEPQLQRYAALAGLRMDETVSTSHQLSAVLANQQLEQISAAAPRASLIQTVMRAARSTAAAAGTDSVSVTASATPLLIACNPIALERAVTHLLVTALHYATGAQPQELRLGVVGDDAELTLTMHGTAVPTGELARLVARFAATAANHSINEDSGEDESASIRVVKGSVIVHSDGVQARSSTAGLHFKARWPLVDLCTRS